MVQIRYEYRVTTYRQSKQLLLPYISRKNSTSRGKLSAAYKMWGQAWASPPRCKTTRAALLPPLLRHPRDGRRLQPARAFFRLFSFDGEIARTQQGSNTQADQFNIYSKLTNLHATVPLR